ncbi:hypothetical protein S83_028875, partial [Arachis hypogaea]
PLIEKQWRPDAQLQDGGDADPPAWIHQQRQNPRIATGATKMNQGELERHRRGSRSSRQMRGEMVEKRKKGLGLDADENEVW